jgi:hypothetical protein
MRAMCFAGRMLVMATWHDHRILLLEAWTKFGDHPGWIGGENLYESYDNEIQLFWLVVTGT